MVWCGSTEVYMKAEAAHATLASFEKAHARQRSGDCTEHGLCLCRPLQEGIPFANGAPNLTVDVPALTQLAQEKGVPICGKDFKTGQTLMKTILAPGPEVANAGIEWMVFDQHPGQPRRRGAGRSGIVQDQGRKQAVRAGSDPSAGALSGPLQGFHPQGADPLLSAAWRQQRRLGQHRHLSDGWAIPCRSRSISSAATAFWPRRSFWTWCCSSIWPSAAACAAFRNG